MGTLSPQVGKILTSLNTVPTSGDSFATICENPACHLTCQIVGKIFPHKCGEERNFAFLPILPRVQGGTTKSGFLAFYVYLSCGEFSHFKRPSLSSFILFPRSSIWIVFHPSMAADLEIALYGGDSVLRTQFCVLTHPSPGGVDKTTFPFRVSGILPRVQGKTTKTAV